MSQRYPGQPQLAPTTNDGALMLELGPNLSHTLTPEVPHSLFLPDSYTPSYAYPLVACLHSDGDSELKLTNWFPEISETNFLGAGIRAPFPAPLGMPGHFCWKPHRTDGALARVRETLETIDRDWNIHPERIHLLGEGSGAVVALQALILQKLGYFEDCLPIAGIVCQHLPPTWARSLPPISQVANGRILFLDPIRTGAEAAALDGLQEAGFDVTVLEKSEQLPSSVINRWLMAAISTTIY